MGFFSSIGNFFRNVGRGIWNGIKSVGRRSMGTEVQKNIGKRVGQFVGIIPKDPEPEEQAPVIQQPEPAPQSSWQPNPTPQPY
ncbi:hypothetical protein TVAG_326530 [Trichomonas vaginalis G3]|uniref:Uncharacterized protein n=1 Tax=Trichomonas vaginalis (strain ATCC PRA-98 / G3) TaxID=412133 RepID=A2FT68_TRIV3|nr:hypothetical protein TVAG_326530 [Trichomonas vaginalis G3]|eukprot:XP_001304839.1 hypothetical protein [Trichomonas vaginalis G3]